MKKKMLVAVAVAILILVAGFFALNSYIYQEKQGAAEVVPYRATLTGTQACLPRRDTGGPQTLECATGLRTDAGEYYALDFNLMSQPPPALAGGQRFTASGLVTPIEMLNSDYWQKYDVDGVFSVTDSLETGGERGRGR